MDEARKKKSRAGKIAKEWGKYAGQTAAWGAAGALTGVPGLSLAYGMSKVLLDREGMKDAARKRKNRAAIRRRGRAKKLQAKLDAKLAAQDESETVKELRAQDKSTLKIALEPFKDPKVRREALYQFLSGLTGVPTPAIRKALSKKKKKRTSRRKDEAMSRAEHLLERLERKGMMATGAGNMGNQLAIKRLSKKPTATHTIIAPPMEEQQANPLRNTMHKGLAKKKDDKPKVAKAKPLPDPEPRPRAKRDVGSAMDKPRMVKPSDSRQPPGPKLPANRDKKI